MDTLSWVTLALAITTFLLAVAAFLSIQQNRSIQRRVYIHNFLKEIIEWAIDAVSWRSRSKHIFKETSCVTDKKQQQVLAASHNWWKFDLAISYSLLSSKSTPLSNQYFL